MKWVSNRPLISRKLKYNYGKDKQGRQGCQKASCKG